MATAVSADRLQQLDKVLKYISGLYGADKVYRLINYGCKVAAGTAMAAGAPVDGKLVKAFKGVGGSVMMTRYSVRFFGLLETISALAHLQRNAAKGAITDKQGAAIEALQHLSMLFYYGLEHYCYVDYASPGTFRAETVGKCERISCGAWFVWILLELAVIYRTRRDLVASGKLTPDAQTDLTLRTVQMVCDGILAVHWTKRSGLGLSDFQVGALGLAGGIATAYLRWKGM